MARLKLIGKAGKYELWDDRGHLLIRSGIPEGRTAGVISWATTEWVGTHYEHLRTAALNDSERKEDKQP